MWLQRALRQNLHYACWWFHGQYHSHLYGGFGRQPNQVDPLMDKASCPVPDLGDLLRHPCKHTLLHKTVATCAPEALLWQIPAGVNFSVHQPLEHLYKQSWPASYARITFQGLHAKITSSQNSLKSYKYILPSFRIKRSKRDKWQLRGLRELHVRSPISQPNPKIVLVQRNHKASTVPSPC